MSAERVQGALRLRAIGTQIETTDDRGLPALKPYVTVASRAGGFR
jgi:hypothetical protein